MVQRARSLRKRSTDAERNLWSILRNRALAGAKFRRQQPIGPYIVDFHCPKNRLVIEIDGGHHLDQIEDDNRRTGFITRTGNRVIRFNNLDVLTNIDGVAAQILAALGDPPHPDPLPRRGEGYAS